LLKVTSLRKVLKVSDYSAELDMSSTTTVISFTGRCQHFSMSRRLDEKYSLIMSFFKSCSLIHEYLFSQPICNAWFLIKINNYLIVHFCHVYYRKLFNH